MAVILDHGVRSMMEEGKDEFYYITAMNENYAQPSMPEGAEAGIVKGLYLFASHGSKKGAGFVRLLGSGAILPEVVEAAKMLEAEWDVVLRSLERDQLLRACSRRTGGGTPQPAQSA